MFLFEIFSGDFEAVQRHEIGAFGAASHLFDADGRGVQWAPALPRGWACKKSIINKRK